MIWIEWHSSNTVGRTQPGNAPGCTQMKKELEKLGTTSTTSSAYTPQSNIQTERVDMILIEKAGSMLELCWLKKTYWCEKVWQAPDLHKRRISLEFDSRTPMEALLGTVLDNSKLRIFGCVAFVQVHKKWQGKTFEGKADRGIYLGDEHGLQRVYLSGSRRCATTRHLSLDECQFSFKKR